jgi:hypothetical protein
MGKCCTIKIGSEGMSKIDPEHSVKESFLGLFIFCIFVYGIYQYVWNGEPENIQEVKVLTDQKTREEKELKEKDIAQHQKGLEISYKKLIAGLSSHALNKVVEAQPKLLEESKGTDGIALKRVVLNPAMTLLVQHKENNEVIMLDLLYKGDGSNSTAKNVFLGMIMLIRTIDASLTEKETGLLLSGRLMANLKEGDPPNKIINNGIVYSLSIKPLMTGLLTIGVE